MENLLHIETLIFWIFHQEEFSPFKESPAKLKPTKNELPSLKPVVP